MLSISAIWNENKSLWSTLNTRNQHYRYNLCCRWKHRLSTQALQLKGSSESGPFAAFSLPYSVDHTWVLPPSSRNTSEKPKFGTQGYWLVRLCQEPALIQVNFKATRDLTLVFHVTWYPALNWALHHMHLRSLITEYWKYHNSKPTLTFIPRMWAATSILGLSADLSSRYSITASLL